MVKKNIDLKEKRNKNLFTVEISKIKYVHLLLLVRNDEIN